MSKKMSFGTGTPGMTGLLKDGYKHMSGLEEAIFKNVEACKALSEITRTSLGPNGMNKLVINHLERVFVTSDAATIVSELEVAHPAAKMVTMAAKMQETEVGDGTNFVVTFAGELLSKAQELLRMGVHPSEVIAGYKRAAEACFATLEELVSYTVEDPRDPAQLGRALTSVLAAKQYGHEGMLTKLVSDAVIHSFAPAPRRAAVNVDNVRVAKLIGGTVSDSQVVKGVVIMKDALGSVKHVSKAKIAVFGCAVEASSTETKGTVVIKTAEELKNYNKGEEKMIEEAIKAVSEAGCNVIVAGGSVSEMALHFIEKYNMLVIKVISKFELRRLCRSVGATALVRLGVPTAGEWGHADKVSVEELSSKRVTVFQQEESDTGNVSTIVLRGSTMNILDDMERSIDDAVNAAKTLCKDGRCVPGAGAAELELALRIQRLGEATPGLEQYAIAKFAEALEVVPRTLAENSGQIATEVISSLYAAHAEGKESAGVDIEDHGILDTAEKDIVDSYGSKLMALRLSADAAITVLRVDQIIMSKQAGGPKPRAPGAPDM